MVAAAMGSAIQVLYGHQIVRSQMAARLVEDNLAETTGMFQLQLPVPSKPCRYCGRTEQSRKHHSCDGCGAPREGR
jgi:hypothetical protein